ncbi:MAG: hypothetical protein ACXVAX_08910 [Pseudobdellovibrio sp.]
MKFSKIDLKLKEMKPVIPVFTGHTQTILGHIVPSKTRPIKYKEHILKLADGDELLLKYFDNKSNVTISLYHGLAGDSDADYIRRSAQIADELKWNIVLVNHRGANAKAKSKRTYHSGRGEDASAVITWARKKFKDSHQVGVGFSMSGSILLNLLTGRFGDEKPDYAVIVNAPLDLKKRPFF